MWIGWQRQPSSQGRGWEARGCGGDTYPTATGGGAEEERQVLRAHTVIQPNTHEQAEESVSEVYVPNYHRWRCRRGEANAAYTHSHTATQPHRHEQAERSVLEVYVPNYYRWRCRGGEAGAACTHRQLNT